MRGKNILWLTLVALLLSVPMATVRAQETPATIWVDPDFNTGYLPGDALGVNIIIDNAVNVYAWEFQLTYYPYMQILVVTDVIEGDFLMMSGGETFMKFNIDHFRGNVRVGGTIIGDIPGVSGGGILCTIMFIVIEAGECPLDLHDGILLDPEGTMMPYTFTDGYYCGPTADFINPPYPNERPVGGGKAQAAWVQSMIKRAGEPFEFVTDITNTGYAPVYARLKFTSVNQKTGETYTFRSGQSFMSSISVREEYIYVNEEVVMWDEWTKVGTSPYLDAPGDGNYIYDDLSGDLSNAYGFEDITLGPMDKITRVDLEGYTRAASTNPDIDTYVCHPDMSMAWLGSLWGDADWDWKTPRWVSDPVSVLWPSATNVADLNALTLAFYHYPPDDRIEVDCVRLKVTIQTGGVLGSEMYYLVEPGETITPDPAIWYLLPGDSGKWYTTVSIEYKYIEPAPGIPQFWTTSEHTYTFEWWCKGALE